MTGDDEHAGSTRQPTDPYQAAAWAHLRAPADGIRRDDSEYTARLAETLAGQQWMRTIVDAVLAAVDAGPPWHSFRGCPREESGNPEDCTCVSGPAATVEEAAKAFHVTYERLAPQHGYVTREASRRPWEVVPESNRQLMVHTVGELVRRGVIVLPAAPSAPRPRLLAESVHPFPYEPPARGQQ